MAGTGSVSVTKVAAVGDIQKTHQYDVTVQFRIAFDWGGYNSVGASYSIKCDGQTQSGTATFNIASGGGSWVWGTIATKTFRITMPTSGKAKTISISASISTGVTPATISASGSKALSAVTWQWAVAYDANGGSGAPGNQTKTYGTSLTLSGTVPDRTGYNFKGWAVSKDAEVADYASGGTYTENKAVTLYAVWELITYTVVYDANGGSGSPASQTKIYGSNLTLSSVEPTRVNYNFKGWATTDTATTATYMAGGSYTVDEDVTLYAVWELAYWAPKISNTLVNRCDSSGKDNPYGVYAKVTFDWECCQITGENTIKSITVKYALHGATTYQSASVTASGKSGSVSKVIGGDLSTDEIYDIVITAVDAKDGTSNTTIPLGSSEFTMDFLVGGKGASIGKPAEIEKLFDVAWDTYLRKKLDVYGALSARGKLEAYDDVNILGALKVAELIQSDGTIRLSAPNIKMEPTASLTYDIPEQTGVDCNELTSSGKYYLGDGSTNRPVDKNGWLESMLSSDGYCHQTYTAYTGEEYVRVMQGGTWGDWTQDRDVKGVVTDLGGIKIWHGTWVTKGGGGSSLKLYTFDTLKKRFGVSSGVNSYNFMTIAQNGDGNACGAHIEGTTWIGTDCYLVFDRNVAATQSIRVNFMTIYTPTAFFH